MMGDDKLLSVVVPAYNMEKYIRKNLDTVTSASRIDRIEIIIVNDGSSDGTLSVCRQYEERFPAIIHIIDKPNGHYGSCINAALQIACGKYFRILDADDWFDTQALDAFVEKLSTCDADLVVTQRCEVTEDKDGNFSNRYFPLHNIQYGKMYDAHGFCMSDYAIGLEFNMHSMTYKTEVLHDVGLHLPEGICYTDMIYCLMPIDRIATIIAYDIYLYHYWVGREGSSTTRSSVKRNFGHITKVLSVMLQYVIRHRRPDDIVYQNQLRFINEATGIYLKSQRYQGLCRPEDYDGIRSVVDGWLQLGLVRNEFNKYYFRYWLKKNTCFAYNVSKILYKISHPFK